MKHIWSIVPCLPYDIEGMESWLTHQSARGRHLSQDGFFAGFGIFEKSEPHPYIYRLDAVRSKGGMFDADTERPDEEALAIAADCGWEFVVRRGDFYIYRTDRADAPDLNTDPDIQALALGAVEKRLRDALWSVGFWAVVYPLARRLANGHGFLRPMISMGTWFSLTGLVISLWLLADAIIRVVHLSRLRRKLRLGGRLDHGKNWERDAVRNHILRISQIVVMIVWGCVLLSKGGAAIMEEGRVTLSDYAGEIPFVTFADLCPEGAYEENALFEENYILEWRDVLSPYNAEYKEGARITTTDGTVYDACLYVDYHVLRFPALARQLAREYQWSDKARNDDYAALTLPDDLDVDWAAAYTDNIHLPTVVLVKGNVVIRVQLLRYSESAPMPLADWARAVAESLSSI